MNKSETQGGLNKSEMSTLSTERWTCVVWCWKRGRQCRAWRIVGTGTSLFGKSNLDGTDTFSIKITLTVSRWERLKQRGRRKDAKEDSVVPSTVTENMKRLEMMEKSRPASWTRFTWKMKLKHEVSEYTLKATGVWWIYIHHNSCYSQSFSI